MMNNGLSAICGIDLCQTRIMPEITRSPAWNRMAPDKGMLAESDLDRYLRG